MFTFNPYRGAKSIAVLIDPDKGLLDSTFAQKIEESNIDFIFVGGSQRFSIEKLNHTISILKEHTSIPIVLFPGSNEQINPQADALLALSIWQADENKFIFSQLIEIINKKEVENLSILYTPYILLNSTGNTSVEKAINYKFQKINHIDLFTQYLKAINLLNCSQIYLEAGSGASMAVNHQWITKAREILPSTYIIVGGGITETNQISDAWNSGADCVVIGTQLEKEPSFIQEIISLKNS